MEQFVETLVGADGGGVQSFGGGWKTLLLHENVNTRQFHWVPGFDLTIRAMLLSGIANSLYIGRVNRTTADIGNMVDGALLYDCLFQSTSLASFHYIAPLQWDCSASDGLYIAYNTSNNGQLILYYN